MRYDVVAKDDWSWENESLKRHFGVDGVYASWIVNGRELQSRSDAHGAPLGSNGIRFRVA